MTNTVSTKSCCTPSRGGRAGDPDTDIVQSEDHNRTSATAVDIPAGVGLIGTNTPRIPNDGESPFSKSKIAAFQMAPTQSQTRSSKHFLVQQTT